MNRVDSLLELFGVTLAWGRPTLQHLFQDTPAPVSGNYPPAPIQDTPAPVQDTPASIQDTPAPVLGDYTPAPVSGYSSICSGYSSTCSGFSSTCSGYSSTCFRRLYSSTCFSGRCQTGASVNVRVVHLTLDGVNGK